jgi:PAS domain S-box-containing protein
MKNATRKTQSGVELQPMKAEELQAENEELRRRLEQAQETIRSIQQDAMAEAQARRSIEARLESELADSKLLQDVSAAIIQSENFQALYDKIMDAATSIMRSDFASMQMLYPERKELRLLASRGYDLAAAKFWEWVRTDSECTCGVAMRTGQRAIAEDIQTCEFMAGTPDQGNALRMGMLAMQSTPLIARSGKLVGMISTHWKQPHTPSERDLRLLDILARQAADLIERKQAEESLQTSEEKYRALFESMDEGYCVIEFFDGPHGPLSDYVHVEANPAYVINAGIPDIVGKKVREMVPDEADGWVEIYRNVLTTGEPVRFERELVATGRYLELSAFRIEPAERRQVAVLFKDITARKKAEAALSAAHARLQKVLEVETVGVMFWDLTTGCMTSANDTFLKMMGYSRADVAAGELTWQRLTPPEYVEVSLTEIRKFQQHGRIGPYEKEYLRNDGTRQWLLFAGSSLGDNTCVEFCVDIADRKQAEQAMREADHRKNEFLAMLAHELRNPLAPIRNAVEILRLTSDQGASVSAAAEMMERQIGQMVRLVDDLLDVSRLSRGKIELRRSRIELAPVIHQAVEAVRPQFESNGLELTVTLPSKSIALNADQARLIQVIGNLLNNACKFTDHGGRVRLSIERVNGQAVIKVEDSGIGIATDQLPRIFDMFMQIDTSLERSTSGLGIGLTLVKNLVEMHDGAVEAHSDGLGRGSSFVVRLPAIVELQNTAPQNTESKTASTTSRRILIVDDNQDAAKSLAMLLKLTGNETHTAYDGLEAVEEAARINPDVILLDLGLPKLNGYEACGRIREQPWGKKLRLIALTGWGQQEDREKTRAAGFDAHMVKPVDFKDLMKHLAEVDADRAH